LAVRRNYEAVEVATAELQVAAREQDVTRKRGEVCARLLSSVLTLMPLPSIASCAVLMCVFWLCCCPLTHLPEETERLKHTIVAMRSTNVPTRDCCCSRHVIETQRLPSFWPSVRCARRNNSHAAHLTHNYNSQHTHNTAPHAQLTTHNPKPTHSTPHPQLTTHNTHTQHGLTSMSNRPTSRLSTQGSKSVESAHLE
jgi:hypothetical protein